MPIEFPFSRTIAVSGFSADEDPNVSAPVGVNVYNVPGQATGQASDDVVRGHAVTFEFVDAAGAYVAAGTVDWTGWYRDEKSDAWTSLDPEAASPANRSFKAHVVARAFVQVTAISAPVGATQLIVRMAPRT